MNVYSVSASPHLKTRRTTRSIMLDVIIALIPALIAAVVFFGLYPLVVTMICVITAVLSEWVFHKIRKTKNTTGDLSAVVTGLLLALNLPPLVPLYVPVIGSIFAIIVVKMLFGGIGKNFANPAITARIFLVLAWGTYMTSFMAPIQSSSEFLSFFSVKYSEIATVASATPLATLKQNSLEGINVLNLFLGRIGGCAGETSALALLLGGVYLAIKKIIDIRIPLVYILLTGLLTCAFKKDISYFFPAIFTGGLFIGAIFMATDYATSPNTKLGVYIYSVGLALLTVLIREKGALPEGVSFAILLMNILAPLLDKIIIPRWFGFVKVKKKKKKDSQQEITSEGQEQKN